MHVEPELGVDGLIAAMDAAGVVRAALIGAAQEPIGKINPLGPPILHACMRVPALRMPLYRIARSTMHQHRRPDNSAVFAAARAYPDRFLPYAFVNPLLGQDAHDELDRCLADGARGLKLHLWFHRYRLPDALPILERVSSAGLPVLAHLGFGPAEDVEIVLDKLPSLKLILAHAGIPHFERLWRLPRVMFDVAATPALISRGTIKRLVEAVGPSRVVYGSDAPIGIRARGGGYRYNPPALPSRCYGDTLASVLD
ncbi:MAG TPA: amidohydrolase family protein [Actinomycetota bacterium]|nr:amidohydrolase family protein [Actinomycetota bacterium]